jgi:hypothetical protein
MSKIDVGEQSFGSIISENYVYADKTELIHNILNSGKYFFLSRPRGFGKTLLLTAFKELFSGREELFEKLWIGQNNRYNFEDTYPVLSLSMVPAQKSPDALEKSLQRKLALIARSHSVVIEESAPGLTLVSLFKSLKESIIKTLFCSLTNMTLP